jgi:hypothetical protein
LPNCWERIGSAINVVLGFVLNRQAHADGVRHHLFLMPMQWPALAMAVSTQWLPC